ncbi:MAG: glycosyltransferase family 2 protein [bacterium]
MSQNLPYTQSPYFHIGRASELEKKSDRLLYRFLEMVPALLSWGTILGSIILAYFVPVAAAIFIIVFDLYWLLKTAYLSLHLYNNWKRTRHNTSVDWHVMLEPLKYEDIYHMVILPFYSESYEVVSKTIEAISKVDYDLKKMIVVLAGEAKAGDHAELVAERATKEYGNLFGHFFVSIHPAGLPGEMPGKGSNITYAAQQTRIHVLDKNSIEYKNVLVSAFDIDTVAYPKYFLCLTWYFLTAEKPYQSSYQPIPLYNNNLWDAPALSRVVAGSGTFWQMAQQERPDKLVTFSSHSINFDTLHKIGYWQTNMVSEDSRIFWNAFMAYGSDYYVVPLAYPVSMDANLASSFWQTLKNIYKQQRRWAWGSENVPYILFNFIKNKSIPLNKKIRITFVQLEGYWSLATNPILILLLGWLPVIIGGRNFNQTVLSYNLPYITQNLMILAMSGLMFSAFVFWTFLPEMPQHYGRGRKIFMFFQWLFVPVTIFIFGAIPGLDAQTRLFLGKYMGFWVTPKHRGKATQ